MSYRYLFVIGTALFTFAHLSSWQTPRTKKASDSSFLKSRLSPIALAYFTGNKVSLKRSVIKNHRSLGLMHLMTPSGLHLSSFFFILKPFIKRNTFKCLLSIIIYLLLIPFDHLSSLKRMTLYSVIKTNPFFSLNSIQSFILTFALSFFLGDYHHQPLSFSLSFLFLGAILFCRHRKEVVISLIMIHLLVCNMFDQVFYPIGFFYGLGITLASPFIFMALLTDALFDMLFFSDLWLALLKFIANFKGPAIYPPFLIALPFFIFPHKPITKRLMLLAVLTFSVSDVNHIKRRGFISKAPSNYYKKVIKKDKITHYYENGLKCSSKLYTDHWSTHCKK